MYRNNYLTSGYKSYYDEKCDGIINQIVSDPLFRDREEEIIPEPDNSEYELVRFNHRFDYPEFYDPELRRKTNCMFDDP